MFTLRALLPIKILLFIFIYFYLFFYMDKRVLTALRTSVNCLCVLPAMARSLQSLAWLLPPWNASGEAGRSGSLHLLGFFWNGRLHVFRWRYNCSMKKEIFLRNMARFQVLVPRTRRSCSFLSQRWNRVSTVVCCGPLLSFTPTQAYLI